MKDDDFRFNPQEDNYPDFNLEDLDIDAEEYDYDPEDDSRLKDAGLEDYDGDIRDYGDLDELFEEEDSFFTRLSNLEPKALLIAASVFGAVFLGALIILFSVFGRAKNKNTPGAAGLIENGTVQTSPGANAAGVSASPSASPVASPSTSPIASPGASPTSNRTPPPVNYTAQPTPTPRPNLTPVVTPTYTYTTPTPTIWPIYTKVSASNFNISTVADQTYTGGLIRPTVTVTYNGGVLRPGTDYDVSYSNSYSVGTANITVSGKGNYYTGSKTVSFRIVPKDISNIGFSTLGDVTYNGSSQQQRPIVTYNGMTLVENTDYQLNYSGDTTNPGTVTVTVTGKGNYTGSKALTYKINNPPATPTPTPVPMSAVTVNKPADVTYTRSEQKQTVQVSYGNANLQEGKDYFVTYSGTVNAGDATVTVHGINGYSGEKSVTYKINPRSITEITCSQLGDVTYDGEEHKQSVDLTYNGNKLEEGKDYTLTWPADCTNTGKVTVTINGTGNFNGTRELSYNINRVDVTVTANNAEITAGDSDPVFTANEQITSGVPMTASENGLGLNYSFRRDPGDTAGNYTIYVEGEAGQGNYNVTYVNGTLTIKERPKTDISGADIQGLNDVTYNGGAQELPVNVVYNGTTLTKDADYSVAYSGDTTNVGTVTVTVTGQGSYIGEKKATYNINRLGVTVTANNASKICGEGDPQLGVTVSVPGLEGIINYSVSREQGEDVRDYTIYVSGDAEQGNYSVSYVNGTFTINEHPKTDISGADIQGLSDVTANGVPQQLPVTVIYNGIQLTENVDYTVQYFGDTINAGTVTVTVYGINGYNGEKSATYNIIAPAPVYTDIANADVLIPEATLTWTGYALEPAVIVTYNQIPLMEGTHYYVSYSNNVDTGTGAVTISGIGEYNGTKEAYFTIVAPEAPPQPDVPDTPAEPDVPAPPQNFTPENLHNKAFSTGARVGINVSEAQSVIDWYNARNSATLDYAMIRVGYRDAYGNCTLDSQFEQNITNALATNASLYDGFKVGVYFELDINNTWDVASAAQQVANWLDSHRYDIAYPVALRLINEAPESTMDSNTRTQIAKDFFSKMKELYPECKTALFVTREDLNNNKFNTWDLGETKLWLCDFADTNDYSGSAMAQVAGNGIINGINDGGNVGMNLSFENFDLPQRPDPMATTDFDYVDNTPSEGGEYNPEYDQPQG